MLDRLKYCFVFLLLACAASAQTVSRADRITAALEPDIKSVMQTAKIPSCTIALVDGDAIVWEKAYGYTNLWAKTPAQLDSVYLIGSTFKAMSTMALLQLMEKGKFKLDDPVNQYLGDIKIKGEDPKNPVTFRHVLTHTSGMPGDFGPFPLWEDAVPPKLEDYIRSSLRVEGPPLEKEVYSNMGYSLIGYLVEKISGQPFKKYIRDNIFQPLEMKDTEFNPRPDMDERMAFPYVPDEKTGEQKAFMKLRATVWPAGLVYGTIDDQARWLITNLNGGTYKGKQIISEATHAEMLRPQFEKFKGPVEKIWGGSEANFGLTWWTEDRGGEKYFAHSGSVPGYTAFLLGNRTRRLGFAILTNGNRSHPHLFKLADKAIAILKSEK
ncbi:MAG: serine hydrolase domain-containing protein [Acidobacteriota bacterium]